MPKSGYSLVELLIVMLIVVVVASLLFPVFARSREGAKRTSCISNLRQTGIALELYHGDWDEYPWQSNTEFLSYFSGSQLICYAVNVPYFYANYVLTANLRPKTEIWNEERLDYRKELLECRDIRGGSMPLATDENHLPRLIRADDQLDGFALVLRAAGNVSRISRKQHAVAINGLIENLPTGPCHRRFYRWNF
ncbi:MAG: DUF1559 domain-containing protein [Fimbriimonadaceae bacterium]|nr:DUF1559 domain-containing protein [Fimbriimonadaceae bacterium]